MLRTAIREVAVTETSKFDSREQLSAFEMILKFKQIPVRSTDP